MDLQTQAVLENILDQLRGAWRFRWVALGIAWVICVLAWIGIFLIPDTYQASARVFVDTRTTLSEVTRGLSVESNVDTQIQRVREAVLGAPQLERVAQEVGLLNKARTAQERELTLQKFHDQLSLTGGMTNQTAGVFVISYKNTDRVAALEVVKRLLNSFVEGTLGGKREGSEQAQKFLVDQISDYEARLGASEERLAKFKKENVGLMPGAQGDYFARLQKETDALQQSQTNLNVAVQRRDELQRQLHGEQPLLPAPLDATKTAAAPAALGGDTATRIRETQERLDELLLRFTDKHPDVIALRATLVELKKRQQEEVDAARKGDAVAAASTGLSANPVYQSIQLQSNQTDVEIAALRADVADHQKRIADLKTLVNTAPEVEAELARLNRDYDVTRAQYHSLLERLQRARLSEDADSTGNVRFEVIDPPSTGAGPIGPKRGVLIVVALVLSMGAGMAVAFLLHLLRPVFISARQLHNVTGLPVLGVVSATWLESYRAATKRRTFGYAVCAAMLVATAGVVFAMNGRISQAIHGQLHEYR
ncbi:MAG TPA: XrtA system polysaccharide chain length determinant [Steroidobacteraceae bacterium]|nr:XrtA system polysaccharide chain length determinant [Steroidobacteraceae bacterium]